MDNEEKRECLQQTQEFTRQKKYKSGLAFLFQKLEQYPGEEFIYQLLSILVKEGMSQTEIRGSAEEGENLKEEDISDPRLDPIFDECYNGDSQWVSGYYFLNIKTLQGTSMRGMRCSSCDRIYCKNCVKRVRIGLENELVECPNCRGKMRAIKEKPSGRKPQRLSLGQRSVVCAMVLREGPLDPDEEYVEEILKKYVPEALEESQKKLVMQAFGQATEDWESARSSISAYLSAYKRNYFNPYFYLVETYNGVYEEDRFLLCLVYDKDLEGRKSSLLAMDHEEKLGLIDAHVSKAQNTTNYHDLLDMVFDLFFLGDTTFGRYVLGKAMQHGPDSLEGEAMPIEIEQALIKDNALQDALQPAYRSFQAKQYPLAVSILTPLLEQASYWAIIHSDLGYFYSILQQAEKATEHLDMALRLDPFLKEAHNNYGLHELFAGNYQAARRHVEKALEIDPNYKEARKNLQQIENAMSEGKSASTERGALFWFHAGDISQHSEGNYGRYIFQQLLPSLKASLGSGEGQLLIFSGDCYPGPGAQLESLGQGQRQLIDRLIQTGVDSFYLVAIHGPLDYGRLSAELLSASCVGFWGITSFTRDVDSFIAYTGSFNLVPDMRLSGTALRKFEFSFLTDEELGEMGFGVV